MKQKGITLVAVIITVILLLILAGVGISIAINEQGLFTKAQEAAFKANMKQYQEGVDMYTVLVWAENSALISSINAGATDKEPKMEMSEILGTNVASRV